MGKSENHYCKRTTFMAGDREQGLKLMNLPLGYDKVDNTTIAINDEEANTVRLIFKMDKMGYCRSQILKVLLGRGDHSRTCEHFTTDAIKKVLDDKKFYQGYYFVGGEWKIGNHPRILPLEDIKIPNVAVY